MWYPAVRAINITIYDIVDFYPSISQELLDKCLKWASSYTNISKTEHETILHARRSILFDNENTPWVKRDTVNQFDVSMGAHDGAEICELVGLYILHHMKQNLDLHSTGIYRDDGLAVMRNHSGPKAERTRKELIKIFKDLGLKITVETNLKLVNYLDVTLDLNTGIYKPYKKPNDTLRYVNEKSNHPPQIIKNIPKAVGKRISDLSSNKESFDDAARDYNAALKSSGYR